MNRMPKFLDPLGVSNCFIAGGAVLSAATKTDIADYDYYPKNLDGLLDVVDCALGNGYVTHISDRAITIKYSGETDGDGKRAIIQVMTYAFFESADDIFKNFDYTVCMGAFDCDTSEYVFHKDFYPDIASKTLRFNPGTLYPLNSLTRISKYRHKGFYISKPEMVKVAIAVANAGMPNSWEELERLIGGTYGRSVTIASDNLMFTIDNVYNVLSEMEIGEFQEEEDTEVDGIKFDDISAFFDHDYVFKYDPPENDVFASDPSTTRFIAKAYGNFVDITQMVSRMGVPENITNRVVGLIKTIDGHYAKTVYHYEIPKKTDTPITEPLPSYDVFSGAGTTSKCDVMEFAFDPKDISELNLILNKIQVKKGEFVNPQEE